MLKGLSGKSVWLMLGAASLSLAAYSGALLAEEKADKKSGKIIVAAPAKVCRGAGGTFGNSFPVPDFGEDVNQAITSVPLNTKLVKTGDKLEIRIVRNRKVLSPAQLKKRTDAFVITEKGFGHIALFSGDTVKVRVSPGETLSITDDFMRNFAKKACVKIRPERLPER